MKVIRSKIMGFCAGVRRAVNVANKALEENDNGQVYTFGPLIHNPIALKKFEEKKLSILTDNEIDQLFSQMSKEKIALFCPHGRPIAYKLTKNELDRQFERIK